MRYKEGILHTVDVINLELLEDLDPTGNKSIANIFEVLYSYIKKGLCH